MGSSRPPELRDSPIETVAPETESRVVYVGETDRTPESKNVGDALVAVAKGRKEVRIEVRDALQIPVVPVPHSKDSARFRKISPGPSTKRSPVIRRPTPPQLKRPPSSDDDFIGVKKSDLHDDSDLDFLKIPDLKEDDLLAYLDRILRTPNKNSGKK